MALTTRPRTIASAPTAPAMGQPTFSPTQPSPRVSAPVQPNRAAPSKRTVIVPSGLSVDPALLKRAASQRLS